MPKILKKRTELGNQICTKLGKFFHQHLLIADKDIDDVNNVKLSSDYFAPYRRMFSDMI